jgi:lipid-A-disaccharide synthase-like uncharacterized protein
MNGMLDLFYVGDRFLGITWHFWKVIGWLGNAAFFSRFLVQWYATERHKRVMIPTLFWWLSLAGSMMLLSYALFYQKDSVFIFAYAFTWIPYVRNLMIQRQHRQREMDCPCCAIRAAPGSRFCSQCGQALPIEGGTEITARD